MTKFVWNHFGKLTSVYQEGSMVIIQNHIGDTRKMSIKTYGESASEVYQKALHLVDANVTIRTSQNTRNWSTKEWFSDIREVSSQHSIQSAETIGESEPKPDECF